MWLEFSEMLVLNQKCKQIKKVFLGSQSDENTLTKSEQRSKEADWTPLTFGCIFVLFSCLIGLFQAVITYKSVDGEQRVNG